MQASELTEVFPFLCISAIWGQYLVVFHILSSPGLPIGSGCSLKAARSCWCSSPGSLWSWPAHGRVWDLSGTPCRDTEDVSSELRAHPQDNWKRPAFPRAFSHHQCKTLATLQKKSNLTFIRLCLIPSTICSIWRKNWSREAGEAMALKDRPAEVWPANRIQEKGRNRGVSPDNAPGGRQASARPEGLMGPLWSQAARDFKQWARHEN